MTIADRRCVSCVLALSGGLLLCEPSAIAAKNDLDRLDLHGHVRTVVTRYPQLTISHRFDRDGRLTSLELDPLSETGAVRYAYEYDATGRLIEEASFDLDGAFAYRKTFRYGVDEHGRHSAKVAVTDDGGFAEAEFAFYDRRGFLAEELTVTAQGVAEKSLFDARGNLLYHARYFRTRLVLESTHHYDPLDRLKESRFYGSDGGRIRTDRYRYDQAGHRIEETSEYTRQSHLRKSVMTYEFDRAGNWTKETIQRWTTRNGSVALTETLVGRDRTITYY
jgi:YD repeat-containing protein